MTRLLERIPTLSLEKGGSAFPGEVGASFETFGFAVIADHGIDGELIARAWALTEALYALPVEMRMRGHVPGSGGARGYTPFGVEIAKDADKHDLKEFWHVGRDLPPGHRFRASMPDNVWPEQPTAFRETFQRLFKAFDTAGNRILSAIAIHLGLTPDWFEGAVQDGNSVLRLLHYPPIPVDADGIRAGAHEDINLITLLLGAEEAGLQLLTRQGDWLAIDPPKGAMVVNVGDMLQRLTNHRLPSTTHRVINPPPERRHLPRYSMPFFLHPASDFLIKTLPQCVDAEHPDRYPVPITADDYLQQRLREIGLK
jgi:isopenicillin N synthase-like dioxygenase